MKKPIAKNFYAIKDVQKIIGVDKNQLFYWINTHRLINPAQKAKGTGTRTLFSLQNLFKLALIKEMKELGLRYEAIRRILTYPNEWLNCMKGHIGLAYAWQDLENDIRKKIERIRKNEGDLGNLSEYKKNPS